MHLTEITHFLHIFNNGNNMKLYFLTLYADKYLQTSKSNVYFYALEKNFYFTIYSRSIIYYKFYYQQTAFILACK